jgi:hypothetical protein
MRAAGRSPGGHGVRSRRMTRLSSVVGRQIMDRNGNGATSTSLEPRHAGLDTDQLEPTRPRYLPGMAGRPVRAAGVRRYGVAGESTGSGRWPTPFAASRTVVAAVGRARRSLALHGGALRLGRWSPKVQTRVRAKIGVSSAGRPWVSVSRIFRASCLAVKGFSRNAAPGWSEPLRVTASSA